MKRNHLILAIGITVLIASCENKKEEIQKPEVLAKYVRTAPIVEKETSLPVYTFGKLAAREERKLSFKIGGIIQSIHVNEGQRVRLGQTLARLDQKEINTQVAGTKANFMKWKRDLKRMEKLHKEKVVTLEALENVKTQYEIARSNLQISEFNQKYSTIISPVNGKVLRKYAEENELTETGKPVFLIGTTGTQMVIKAGLADKEVVNLNEGDSANIQFDALPGLNFSGKVLLIDNAPDPKSGLYETEIILNETHSGLRNGFFAKVQIYPSKYEKFQFLPIESLVEGNKMKGFVYAIRENRAEKVAIDIHRIQHNQLVVHHSIHGYNEIVTEGAQYLDHNDEVIIVNN